ncbi:HipA domain-containing protein [Vibrio alginolyticus]
MVLNSIAEIMQLLNGSTNTQKDRDEFRRFQMFPWLLGATDGHAKTFQFLLRPMELTD